LGFGDQEREASAGRQQSGALSEKIGQALDGAKGYQAER